jgi:hypothetical protein
MKKRDEDELLWILSALYARRVGFDDIAACPGETRNARIWQYARHLGYQGEDGDLRAVRVFATCSYYEGEAS